MLALEMPTRLTGQSDPEVASVVEVAAMGCRQLGAMTLRVLVL